MEAAYRAELARYGWPLSREEEAAVEPVHQAVRVGLASWPMEQGRRTGQFDLTLSSASCPGPGSRHPDPAHGVRVTVERRRERAEDESEAGTRRLAWPRPWGGMLP
jgi:hypothetical protein